MRHVHRIKREAEQEARQPTPGLRQGELALEGGRAEAPRRSDTVTPDTTGKLSPERDATPAQFADDIPPVEAERLPLGICRRRAGGPYRGTKIPPGRTCSRLTKPCCEDWNELTERVRQTGEPLFYAKGLHRHDPTYSGGGGERANPGRNKGAVRRGAPKPSTGSLSAPVRGGLP